MSTLPLLSVLLFSHRLLWQSGGTRWAVLVQWHTDISDRAGADAVMCTAGERQVLSNHRAGELGLGCALCLGLVPGWSTAHLSAALVTHKMLLKFDPHLWSLTELSSFTQTPHDISRPSGISQTASPGDSPAWPVPCSGPFFDGAVALGSVPTGSCGTAQPGHIPGAVEGTACWAFFQLHQLEPSGSETTAYCALFTMVFGVFLMRFKPWLAAVP